MSRALILVAFSSLLLAACLSPTVTDDGPLASTPSSSQATTAAACNDEDAPSYPSDCSQVSQFQCGFYGQCQSGTVTVQWHEHWRCDQSDPTSEKITPYSCTFTCTYGCRQDGDTMEWPSSGADLIAQACNDQPAPPPACVPETDDELCQRLAPVCGATVTDRCGQQRALGCEGCRCEGTGPTYPSDCSQVSQFQCGFYGQCQDGTVTVQWHEHWLCDQNDPESEQTTPYSCTFTCPKGCRYEGAMLEWPASGSDLVSAACADTGP